MGSSILGFHTQFHCNNFLDGVDRFLESRIDREQNAVVHQGQWTLVRPYPISIEWPSGWLKATPPVAECRTSVLAELGLAPDALLGVGVDRLDYTKGIEERLLAVERLLERAPALRGRFSFVQLAAPSRTVIPRYRQLADSVEEIAARVNQRFASGSYRPVILKRAHHEPPMVFRYYRAADVCYVSSLHDGMNLVAKEFVAARDDEQGVLVLSHFTGAARELTEALSVNPYDLEEASAALEAALAMPKEEQRDRMRSMRTLLAEFNVYRWAGRMLVDAARLRRRERLSGRLSGFLPGLGRRDAVMRYLLAPANREVLEQFARSRTLLAFDFDGTLAPIVRDPERAALRPSTRRLLREAARAYPCVVISGRSRADVRRRLRGIPLADVIGNHGGEPWHAGARARREVRRWLAASRRCACAAPAGVVIEDKGLSLSVHYRGARQKKRVRARILAATAELPDARATAGKLVVNVVPAGAPHKGQALVRERARLGCDTAVYLGDDETDEDVFALDQPGQLLTVRVGRKQGSAAAYYIRRQAEIDRVLRSLLASRPRPARERGGRRAR